MALVDIAIILVIVVSILVGIFRGFVRELLSLVSWIVAAWLAYRFAEPASALLQPYLEQPPVRIVAAFIAIFLLVLVALSVISFLIHRTFTAVGIGGVDRSLGAIFGVVRGVVLVALLVLAARFMAFTEHDWWSESRLVGRFDPVAEMIRSLLPPDLSANFAPGTTRKS